MVRNRCTAAVMEVSSHALHQGRTAGLPFDVGVFTNLSGDHLDYHGTPDAYGEAKATLLRSLPAAGWAVVNMDDPAASRMTNGCRARVLSCSLADPRADCRARIHHQSITGIDAEFSGPWGSFDVQLPLAGRHNVANALEASAACFTLGVDRSTLPDALACCPAPPGRLEPVTEPGDPVTVLVDYAHTDDALANVLRTLRPLVPDGASLRVVFGCGGDRDRTKRPRMGQVAAQLADELYVTSDNPRTEDPQAIIDEITKGIPGLRWPDTVLLVDRKLAIESAIDRTRPGDVVLIAGKGHEPYQIVGSEKRPFDDRLTAAEALAHHRSVAKA
jgi:UDP-N-acetylmuramoyl-L-alanyl-D-glutamate--2,6-diaminopimelate ligase